MCKFASRGPVHIVYLTQIAWCLRVQALLTNVTGAIIIYIVFNSRQSLTSRYRKPFRSTISIVSIVATGITMHRARLIRWLDTSCCPFKMFTITMCGPQKSEIKISLLHVILVEVTNITKLYLSSPLIGSLS